MCSSYGLFGFRCEVVVGCRLLTGFVFGFLLVVTEGKAALSLQSEGPRQGRGQPPPLHLLGLAKKGGDAGNLLFNGISGGFMFAAQAMELFRVMQMQPPQDTERRGGSCGRRTVVAFGDGCAFEFPLVGALLQAVEHREETAAIVGRVIGIGGKSGSDLHIGLLSVSVKD